AHHVYPHSFPTRRSSDLDKEPEKLAERFALAAQPGPTKYLHTPLELKFVAPASHPIARGFSRLRLLDEPYWPMFGDPKGVEVLRSEEHTSELQSRVDLVC